MAFKYCCNLNLIQWKKKKTGTLPLAAAEHAATQNIDLYVLWCHSEDNNNSSDTVVTRDSSSSRRVVFCWQKGGWGWAGWGVLVVLFYFLWTLINFIHCGNFWDFFFSPLLSVNLILSRTLNNNIFHWKMAQTSTRPETASEPREVLLLFNSITNPSTFIWASNRKSDTGSINLWGLLKFTSRCHG